ncbi:MAG TPA: histidine kinase [Saprospiraceae bacterium]|nr:histidine kinase [Saprospiraceae bacterium]
MVTRFTQPYDLEKLEYKILANLPPHQKIVYVEQLVSVYAFINVVRADELLDKFELLVEQTNLPDMELAYNWWRGIVDNHLYKHESSVEHFEKAIDIAEARAAAMELAELYIDFIGVCVNTKELEKAWDYLEKADDLLEAFPNPLLYARLQLRYGYYYLQDSLFYFNAVEFLIDAKNIFTSHEEPLSLKNIYFLIMTYGGFGELAAFNGVEDDIIEAHQTAIELGEQSGVSIRLAWNYLSAGNGLMSAGELELAEEHFKKAQHIKQDPSTIAIASATANLGFIQLEYENYQQALDFFDKADELYKIYSPDDMRNIATVASWRAQAYSAIGKKKKAKRYFLQALDLLESGEEQNDKIISNTYKQFADFYAELEDYKQAYECHIQYTKFRETHEQSVKKQEILRITEEYESKKKEQEAVLLRLERNKLQMKALRAQMNPHFMYNALNAIQNYITSEDSTFAASYLAKFSKLMRKSLEYSDLEYISLEQELEFLKNYLDINQKLRFDQLNYTIEVDDDIEEDIMGVPSMIVQPYVENAIEHGLRTKKTGGVVKVILRLLNQETILCVVEDNGIGRDAAEDHQSQHQEHKSKGTRITEDRLRLLNQGNQVQVYVETIDLFDEEGVACGTRVEIKIPIVNILKGNAQAPVSKVYLPIPNQSGSVAKS